MIVVEVKMRRIEISQRSENSFKRGFEAIAHDVSPVAMFYSGTQGALVSLAALVSRSLLLAVVDILHHAIISVVVLSQTLSKRRQRNLKCRLYQIQ